MYYITDAMSMANEKAKTETITLRITAELKAQIVEWRRAQPDLPNQTEAIERMIEMAVAQKGRKR
jgi:hypothetical protein